MSIHFLLQAKKKPFSFRSQPFNNQLLWSPIPLFEHADNPVLCAHDLPRENFDKLLQSCEPIERFLEFKNSSHPPGSNSLNTTMDFEDACRDTGKDTEEHEYDISSVDQYSVSLSLIERWGSAMGILLLAIIN